MKRKDLKNLIAKSVSELEKLVIDLEKQAHQFSMDLKSRKLKNTNMVKNIRRSIAQVKTVISEKTVK